MIRIDDEDDRFADDFEVRIPEDSSNRRDSLYDGYVVDPRGKIRGEVRNYDPYSRSRKACLSCCVDIEVRNYDPYSRFGDIMLYDIDIFGYVPGYVARKWQVMSEQDLLADKNLARRLYETKYQVWMRHNGLRLKVEYIQKYRRFDKRKFEKLCRELYNRLD